MEHVLINCIVCGEIIKKDKNHGWTSYYKRKYCSRKCSAISKKSAITINCENCNKELIRPPSQIKDHIFCDQKCRKEFYRGDKICIGCGEPFKNDPKTPANVYCTFECFKQSRWVEVQCIQCNRLYKKRLCEYQKAIENGHQHLCSRSCRNEYTSKLLGGDGTWIEGGKYKSLKNKYGPNWKPAKKDALERDNHRCQQCSSNELPEVHHWTPYNISFDNSLDNLITLCRECHQEMHAFYRREGFYEDLVLEGFWD